MFSVTKAVLALEQISSTSLFTTVVVCSLDVVYFQTETTLNDCFPVHEMFFWTAGQRIDPSRESAFVWRVTSTDTDSDRVSVMTYINWYPGEPSYTNSRGQVESCMNLWHGPYRWNDERCSSAMCSVCELDL